MLPMWNMISRKSFLFDHVTCQNSDSALWSSPHVSFLPPTVAHHRAPTRTLECQVGRWQSHTPGLVFLCSSLMCLDIFIWLNICVRICDCVHNSSDPVAAWQQGTLGNKMTGMWHSSASPRMLFTFCSFQRVKPL